MTYLTYKTWRGIVLVTTMFLISCNQQEVNTNTGSVTIDVIPFGDISQEDVNYISIALKKTITNIEIKPKQHLPQKAYYAERNRYRADTLIGYLSKQTTNNHVALGLTTKDISHTKGKVKDYGIMGLGFKPGNACIVSSYRLTKENKQEQFFKVCIHELGHTAGLPHCPEKTCFMRDAEGKNHTNEEVDFCKKCKMFLISKGWNLN